MASEASAIYRPTAEMAAQKEQSPYWIEGSWFFGPLKDSKLQIYLHTVYPFAMAGDTLGTVIQKNLIALLHTLLFYAHFFDLEDAYLSAAAEDLGWNVYCCEKIVRHFVGARAAFFARSKRAKGPASGITKILCDLIDRYKAVSTSVIKQRYSSNRMTYILLTRTTWRNMIAQDPAGLVAKSFTPPTQPPENPDWLVKSEVQSTQHIHPAYSRNARSKSPDSSTTRHVRTRSPLSTRVTAKLPERLNPAVKEGPMARNNTTSAPANMIGTTFASPATDCPAAVQGKTSIHYTHR